jgi:hypothetical protein
MPKTKMERNFITPGKDGGSEFLLRTVFAMSNPTPNNPTNPSAQKSNREQAHDALLARLARLESNLVPVRPPKSLQPTPEAAKTRVSRLRKKRLLIQRSKRPLPSHSTIPPARDPLAP